MMINDEIENGINCLEINDKYIINDRMIEGKEVLVPIKEDETYKAIDELCAQLIRIRDYLLEHSSLAFMNSIVCSSSQKPIIGTQALDTCYGILFYNRSRKSGMVGHGMPSGLSAILYEMIKKVNDGSEQVIEFAFVPGFRNVDYNNLEGLTELQNGIVKFCPPNIRFVPFKGVVDTHFHENTLTYEFAFDVRTGTFVSSEVFFDEIDVNPRFKKKGSFGR